VTPKVYILLPVHNRREITRRFLACLLAQRFANYHLILIDDGSTDGTAAIVSETIPTATVIRGTGDWWWAGSLQQGLDWLRASDVKDSDLVLFINDDVEFDADYLETATRVIARYPGTMVLSKLRDPVTREVSESGVEADFRAMRFGVARTPDRVNCLSTRGLFIRWGDVRRIGGFLPRLLPHYLSDYEYTIRGHRKGLACVTSDDLLLVMDKKTTGLREFDAGGFATFVKQYFSRRSAANPLYWTSFVLLAAPFPWKVINVLRIWRGVGGRLLKRACTSR